MGYSFDIISLFVLAGCILIGLKRGFFKEFFDVLALAAAICIVGLCEFLGVNDFYSPWGSELAGHILMLLMEFVFSLVVVRLLGSMIRKAIGLGPLRIFERLAGGTMAAIKAFLCLGFILVILARYPILGTEWMQQSILAPLFLFAGRAIIYILPGDFAEALRSFLSG